MSGSVYTWKQGLKMQFAISILAQFLYVQLLSNKEIYPNAQSFFNQRKELKAELISCTLSSLYSALLYLQAFTKLTSFFVRKSPLTNPQTMFLLILKVSQNDYNVLEAH